MLEPSQHLILASQSEARGRLLRQAGVDFEAVASFVDEEVAKASLKQQSATGAQIAETLAEMKAKQVSLSRPDALVIGGDQVLDCNGVLFDKPGSLDMAKAHLMALQGKRHQLHTSVCLVQNGQRLWHYNGLVSVELIEMNEDQIAVYLNNSPKEIMQCVGCYQIEGLGAQLFARIEGDIFTVQGLPLIELLTQLRRMGVLNAFS